MVSPSCPALLIHDDDAFRKSLIAALDQTHFTVSYFADATEAASVLQSEQPFKVVVLQVDFKTKKGVAALDQLQANRGSARVIVISDSNPDLRSYARLADETLLKPVDPAYVARRAQTYCAH